MSGGTDSTIKLLLGLSFGQFELLQRVGRASQRGHCRLDEDSRVVHALLRKDLIEIQPDHRFRVVLTPLGLQVCNSVVPA